MTGAEVGDRLARHGVIPVIMLDHPGRPVRSPGRSSPAGWRAPRSRFARSAAEAGVAALAEDPAARRRRHDRVDRPGRPRRRRRRAVRRHARLRPRDLVEHCRALGVPVYPGVATASEVMAAAARRPRHGQAVPRRGHRRRTAMLAALAGPFPGVRFIPTGGVDGRRRSRSTCAMPCVLAVGGSWIVARDAARRRRLRRRSARSPPTRWPGPPPQRGMSVLDAAPARGVRVRPGRAGRGDAPPRPRRRAHPHRARASAPGRAAANTTSPAACADASGCGPPSSPRSPTTRSGVSSRTSSCRAGSTPRSSSGAPYDGVGRQVRNGLNFTERGFGVRGAVGVSDRGHTAASQLTPGDVDWEHLFGTLGVRWLHTGGIFAALSPIHRRASPRRRCARRRRHGTIVSYDLNYRPWLWKTAAARRRRAEVNRALAQYVDVMIGNEEDFTACLGFEVHGASTGPHRPRRRRLPER